MSIAAVDAMVWAGTVVFAVTGAFVAVEKRFDLIGVLMLGGVTAIGGGSVRDLVVGTVPPPALRNEGLLWAIAATCLLTFLLHRDLRHSTWLYVLDTTSLALFASLGAQTGHEAGLGFWGTVLAGTVSGVGGGMIRDTLAGEIPRVLHRAGDLHASAAAVGAATVYVSWPLGEIPALAIGVAATACTRLGSRSLGLSVPTPRPR